jgi:hypothetical protein
MGLRNKGSVIGNFSEAKSYSATGIWTGQEVYTYQKAGTWQVPPTFSLSTTASNVNEGASITYTLETTGVPNGTLVPYTIAGSNITLSDFTPESLSGNFVIIDGIGTVSLTANADIKIEGTEYVLLSVAGLTSNVTINDTSTGFDAQFPYVVTLLNADGTNGAQNNTFLDSSTNNATITRNGNATQGTFSPYGPNWSNYFNGSTGYLSFANNTAFDLSTGAPDWTIETWFYTTTLGVQQTIVQKDGVSGSRQSQYMIYITAGNLITVLLSPATGPSGHQIFTGSAVTLNTWYHVAAVRSGSNITLFLNGVIVAGPTALSITMGNNTGALTVGTNSPGASYFAGYISNLRIVKGTAVYTAAFTPNTSPLTAITNTSLLTCQSNRFIDNSSNAFIPTATGLPIVQRFSPFNLSSSYIRAIYGGSGYFDGNGDYLSTPTTAPFQLGTGDFTFEAWIYLNTATTGTDYRIFTAWGGGADSYQFYLRTTNLRFIWQIFNQNSPDVAALAITPFTWTHIAVCRASGSIKTFINGVLQDTTSGTNSANTGASPAIGADNAGTTGFPGYISDLRILKGTALYTANITPPTAPLTAIANTSILLSATNAGIYDSAMMSDIVTNGTTQISTAVVKYGTGSIKFNGGTDYLIPNSANSNINYAFGTGDFTVEAWLYMTAGAGVERTIIDSRPASTDTTSYYAIAVTAANVIGLYAAAYRITGNTSMSNNTWYHVAVSRYSGNTKLFLNGIQQGNTYVDTNNYLSAAARPVIGSRGNTIGTFSLTGNMDDIRFTKGYARYTSNFTAPSSILAGQ